MVGLSREGKKAFLHEIACLAAIPPSGRRSVGILLAECFFCIIHSEIPKTGLAQNASEVERVMPAYVSPITPPTLDAAHGALPDRFIVLESG